VALQLRIKQQEHFVPLSVKSHQWSDRIKMMQEPLFPGYVFCRTRRSSFGIVLNTLGVIRIVSFGGRPFPLSDEEVSTLQRVVSSGRETAPAPYLAVGQRVQVTTGLLAGVTGIIIRVKGRNRLVISIDLIMKSISVEIAASELATLEGAAS
jgi:transcription antitermination factor NusG